MPLGGARGLAAALAAFAFRAVAEERSCATAEWRDGSGAGRPGSATRSCRSETTTTRGTAGVFNGSVGRVTALSLEDQELRVPVGRGRGGRLRVRRAGRVDPCLCGQHPPFPRQRVPLRGHPNDDQRLTDAAAQPALHRRDPGQTDGGPGRQPTRPGQSGPHPSRRPPPHRPYRAATAGTGGYCPSGQSDLQPASCNRSRSSLSSGCCGGVRRQVGEAQPAHLLHYPGIPDGARGKLACMHRLERSR
jgi:hypothetical protein